MLSSNSQNGTITYFLRLIQSWNPKVWPAYIMTDCDQAQIAALEAVYPQSQVLLCTWHVLHVIWSHFRTDQFPELWALVKKLVHTSDLAEFNEILDKISSDPAFPQSWIFTYTHIFDICNVIRLWLWSDQMNQLTLQAACLCCLPHRKIMIYSLFLTKYAL